VKNIQGHYKILGKVLHPEYIKFRFEHENRLEPKEVSEFLKPFCKNGLF